MVNFLGLHSEGRMEGGEVRVTVQEIVQLQVACYCHQGLSDTQWFHVLVGMECIHERIK
jgi:hypothetical protein